nr:reverse transcriptase domain-containing protein [Tanacetum cinerariifolium]
MDDEPMWVVDRVVALTPGFAITILETANEFAIKGNHLTLIKGNQFDGKTKTDPRKHIHEFLGICNMFKYRDTKNKVVRLMMFPLSLTGEAKTWLEKLNEGTIETWDELRTAFISRFFPPTLFDQILKEIRDFSQHENESLTDAWLRVKEMLRNCHVLNAATGGIFLYKTPNKAYQLLEDNVLLKLDWAKNQKTKSSLKKTVAFAAEANSNFDTDKIMARMDAMTMKMDAHYKDFQSRLKQPNLDDDGIPMSHEEEAKLMQTFRCTRFYNDYSGRDSNRYNWRLSGRNDYNRDNYQSHSDDKPNLQKQLSELNTRPILLSKTLLCISKTNSKQEPKIIKRQFKISKLNSTDLLTSNLVDPLDFFLVTLNLTQKQSFSPILVLALISCQLSLETLKPTKISVRLADRSFQYPIGIAKNMIVEVGKFTFPTDFIILEMEEDSKVPLVLGRPFLYTVDAVIQVKQKQLNLEHCEDAHLILNWEKCHFMVKQGIVLGHKVSEAGIEADKAKIDVISKLPPPNNIKGFRVVVLMTADCGYDYFMVIHDDDVVVYGFSKLINVALKSCKKNSSESIEVNNVIISYYCSCIEAAHVD